MAARACPTGTRPTLKLSPLMSGASMLSEKALQRTIISFSDGQRDSSHNTDTHTLQNLQHPGARPWQGASCAERHCRKSDGRVSPTAGTWEVSSAPGRGVGDWCLPRQPLELLTYRDIFHDREGAGEEPHRQQGDEFRRDVAKEDLFGLEPDPDPVFLEEEVKVPCEVEALLQAASVDRRIVVGERGQDDINVCHVNTPSNPPCRSRPSQGGRENLPSSARHPCGSQRGEVVRIDLEDGLAISLELLGHPRQGLPDTHGQFATPKARRG